VQVTRGDALQHAHGVFERRRDAPGDGEARAGEARRQRDDEEQQAAAAPHQEGVHPRLHRPLLGGGRDDHLVDAHAVGLEHRTQRAPHDLPRARAIPAAHRREQLAVDERVEDLDRHHRPLEGRAHRLAPQARAPEAPARGPLPAVTLELCLKVGQLVRRRVDHLQRVRVGLHRVERRGIDVGDKRHAVVQPLVHRAVHPKGQNGRAEHQHAEAKAREAERHHQRQPLGDGAALQPCRGAPHAVERTARVTPFLSFVSLRGRSEGV
jgi:hypothetical protein